MQRSVELTCAGCGRIFLACKRTAIACSSECRLLVRFGKPKGCKVCGSVFRPKSDTQECCGRACASVASVQAAKGRSPERICHNCGIRFKKKHSSGRTTGKYCSRNCYFHGNKAAPPSSSITPCKCRECGRIFISRLRVTKATCSEECRVMDARKQSSIYSRHKYERIPLIEQKCAECGNSFNVKSSDGSRAYCSQRCGRKVHKRSRKVAVAKRLEPVRFADIYDRENGKCHICGLSASRHREIGDLLRATIDHVTPIAKGGDHSKQNTRIAHFTCNSTKGTKPVTEDLRRRCRNRVEQYLWEERSNQKPFIPFRVPAESAGWTQERASLS